MISEFDDMSRTRHTHRKIRHYSKWVTKRTRLSMVVKSGQWALRVMVYAHPVTSSTKGHEQAIVLTSAARYGNPMFLEPTHMWTGHIDVPN